VITVQGALDQQTRTAAVGPTTHDLYLGDGLIYFRPSDRALFVADRTDRNRLESTIRERNRIQGIVQQRGADAFNVRVTSDGGETSADILTVTAIPLASVSLPQILEYYDVTLMNPRVLAGLFLGVMTVFIFCAMTMNAVGRAAFAMMQECRRQFGIMREALRKKGMSEAEIADPTKWPYQIEHEGKTYPDYANCVAISTAGAQREMVVPSLLAVLIPIATGLVLGVAGTMGLLAGATVSGFAMAIFMANAGGAWDNCKKFIEAGNYGGKGSFAHKAGVVGDTVGDPFKDTSGPSLNILIKLMSIVAVVFAGLIVKFSPVIGNLIGL
jgi:K(+)-stimulated pyrophosphate-energized sodium pump